MSTDTQEDSVSDNKEYLTAFPKSYGENHGTTEPIFDESTSELKVLQKNGKIHCLGNDFFTYQEALLMAERLGWPSIETHGDETFRTHLWLIASAIDTNVVNYQINAAHIALRMKFKGSLRDMRDHIDNVQTETPMKYRSKSDEMISSFLDEDKIATLERYPQLSPVYQHMKAAQSFTEHSKARYTNKGRKQFLDGVAAKAIKAIAAGKSIPILSGYELDRRASSRNNDKDLGR